MHIPKAREERKMTKNTYFEEIERVTLKFTEDRERRKAEKEEIINTKGWGSEELKEWRARDEEIKFPYDEGTMKAFRAWYHQEDNGFETETLVFPDFLWDKEVPGFIRALKKAGINEFIYTCTSTALMDNIHDLEEGGFMMTGLAEIKNTSRWTTDEFTRGLRFEAR